MSNGCFHVYSFGFALRVCDQRVSPDGGWGAGWRWVCAHEGCPTGSACVDGSGATVASRVPIMRTYLRTRPPPERWVSACPADPPASAVADGGELLGQAAAEGRHEC